MCCGWTPWSTTSRSAINDARDIIADPHFSERTLVDLTGSQVLGAAVMPGPVLHMASYPGPVSDGVPAIGEHTRPVLTQTLGLAAADLDELTARGIIGRAWPLPQSFRPSIA